jgi:ABC-type Fe3+-hydroxamate transport system substrate-binding protein
LALRPRHAARPAQAARREDLGRALARASFRIVSLVPSITELVCELGLAAELVGRTGFCIHPKEVVRGIPKVGGTKSVNLAKVRALSPTHAILNIDENRKETADALAEFVPNLIVTHPLAPEDNLALYKQMGSAFGKEREAEALCEKFSVEFRRISEMKFKSRNVLYLIWKDPWMTVSRDTYISRTLALFGLQTLPRAAEVRYPKLKELDVPGAELVLLSSEPYRFRQKHADEIQRRLQKPCRLIDGEMTSWYGPRAIEGLRYLARFDATLASSPRA